MTTYHSQQVLFLPPFLCLQNNLAPTIVLITGASRGIGKALLLLYLAKPRHTVDAPNRDPNNEISKALADLSKAEGTSLLLIRIDITVPTDPADVEKQLAWHGIDHAELSLPMLVYLKFSLKFLRSRSRICKGIPSLIHLVSFGSIKLLRPC